MDGLGTIALAYLTLPIFGVAIAMLPPSKDYAPVARISFAFLAGAVVLTIEATFASIAGIRWHPVPLMAVPLIAAIAVHRLYPHAWFAEPSQPRPRLAIGVAWTGAAAAVLHLIASIATSRANSVDYIFFWGVKAARFADARSIDAELLRWQFFDHAVPDYPPLVPVVQAWGAIFAGTMPWLAMPLTSALWIVAASPLIAELLRERGDGGFAWTGTAFWTAAIALSLAYSFSGGNAEAVLVAFVSIAGAAVLALPKRGASAVAAVAMAGAVLTKVEAIVPVAALLIGMIIRELSARAPRAIRRTVVIAAAPVLSLALWFAFQWTSALEVGYRGHGKLTDLHWEHLWTILAAFPRNLQAGSWWIAWLAPLVALVVTAWRNPAALRRVTPLLGACVLLFGFLVFDYLHDAGDPTERIGWTLPRVAQPAMALLILAAVAASGPKAIAAPIAAERPK
ncbi:MAG: hypothetical protein ACYC7A_01225 [Thermoanaerobaculia bacterium]